jgi:hypothetical protein
MGDRPRCWRIASKETVSQSDRQITLHIPAEAGKRLDPPREFSTRGGCSRKIQPSANVLHGRRIRHADVPSDEEPNEHRAAEAPPISQETRRKPPRPSDDNRLAKHTLDRALRPESRRSQPAAQSEPLPPQRR